MLKNKLLKEYYRVDSLSESQEKIIDAIYSGQDILAGVPLERDGEICIQLPAFLSDGTAVVISENEIYMNGLVLSFARKSYKAAYLNSTLDSAQQKLAMDNMKSGMYKLVYVTPEMFVSPEFFAVISGINISYIAVDKAQYASGNDAEPAPIYSTIAENIERLPKRPAIAAFTSSLKGAFGQKIADVLKLKQDHITASCFDRKNLSYKLEICSANPYERYETLKKLISERRGKSGIVFCASINVQNELYDRMNADGLSVAKQPMYPSKKPTAHDDFQSNSKDILLLPSGHKIHINKHDVAYVIHYNLPRDIEIFYLESREAGIDGSPAESILIYSCQDPAIIRNTLKGRANEDIAKAKMNVMAAYAETAKCLRRYLLSCFGEEAPSSCGNCSNCLDEGQEFDLTEPAKAILNCISTTGQQFSEVTVKAVLRGTITSSVVNNKLNSLPIFGTMPNIPDEELNYYISLMEEHGFITVSDNKYKVLSITPKGQELLNGQITFTANVLNRIIALKNKLGPDEEYEIDDEIMSILMLVRERIANEMNIEPHQVVPITSIIDMCKRLPCTLDELKEIPGMSRQKLERYGEQFLEGLNYHLINSGVEPQKVKIATPQEKRQLVRKLEQDIGVPEGTADWIYDKNYSGPVIKNAECYQYDMAKLYFMRDEIPVSDEKITINAFLIRIVEKCYSEVSVLKFSKTVHDLLIGKGLLEYRKDDEGNTAYSLTNLSEQTDIFIENVTSASGRQFDVVLIGKKAQQLIISELGNMALNPVK